MNRFLMMVAAAGVVLVTAAGAVPQASAAVPARSATVAAAKAECTTKYRVTGRKVAVRRPAWNDTNVVATPSSPVVRTLKRGRVVTSCTTMIARTEGGPAYHKCGKDGHLWRVAEGGQIPATCLEKISG